MLISISIYVHIYKPAKPKRPEGLDSFHMHFFLINLLIFRVWILFICIFLINLLSFRPL